MMDTLAATIDVLYSTGGNCSACGNVIENVRLVRLTLPADKDSPLDMHFKCIEELGWRINYFTFHNIVDETSPTGVN